MKMLRTLRILKFCNKNVSEFTSKRCFLTNAYNCSESWNTQTSSSILNKVNLNDFYIAVDQNFTSKGLISAIDVDIFANAIKDSTYLEELRDLLYKLRASAATGDTLESTHHATVRKFLSFGQIEDLIEILKYPLIYGVFLDPYSANILLDKLITSEDFENAAQVASLIMLQEDYSNDISCALSKYACYKFITTYIPPSPEPETDKKEKVEEIKIRIKFLRNPYFDDHFDLTNKLALSGKTLAWMSETDNNCLNINTQILGWLYYEKYEKLLQLCQAIAGNNKTKVYTEVKELLLKAANDQTTKPEIKTALDSCISALDKLELCEETLEQALITSIENAINKSQNKDIAAQEQLFTSWAEIRQTKLNEQIKRLDRAKRLQLIQEKQDKLKEEEQKLWFFENEDQIDLQIEEKEAMEDKSVSKKKVSVKGDDSYIPPEIIPRRR